MKKQAQTHNSHAKQTTGVQSPYVESISTYDKTKLALRDYNEHHHYHPKNKSIDSNSIKHNQTIWLVFIGLSLGLLGLTVFLLLLSKTSHTKQLEATHTTPSTLPSLEAQAPGTQEEAHTLVIKPLVKLTEASPLLPPLIHKPSSIIQSTQGNCAHAFAQTKIKGTLVINCDGTATRSD